jgi:hypothetical protein
MCEVATQTQNTKGLQNGYYHVHDSGVLSN